MRQIHCSRYGNAYHAGYCEKTGFLQTLFHRFVSGDKQHQGKQPHEQPGVPGDLHMRTLKLKSEQDSEHPRVPKRSESVKTRSAGVQGSTGAASVKT